MLQNIQGKILNKFMSVAQLIVNYKLQEYQPSTTNGGQADDSKKRKSEEVPPVSEVIIPVKKQRVAHASVDAPSRLATLVPAKPPQRLSAGMMMIDRYKKFQEAKAAVQQPPWPQTTSAPQRHAPPSSSGPEKKRIAHVPNVMGLLSAKTKITAAINSGLPASSALPAGQVQQSSQQPPQQRTLGSNAVRRPALPIKTAAPPPQLPRPMIAVELGCRVPANIRQKYLNILVDEMLKIYDREEDAYQRAVEEEKQSYAKCSSKVVYVNVITNLVQRIRRESESSNNPTSANQSKIIIFLKDNLVCLLTCQIFLCFRL